MLPRPYPAAAVGRKEFSFFWCFRACVAAHLLRIFALLPALIVLPALTLLAGCEPQSTTTPALAPATTVPTGVFEFSERGVISNTSPRASALTQLAESATAAGFGFDTIYSEAAGSPAPTSPANAAGSALAVVLRIDLQKFEPVLLTAANGISPQEAMAEDTNQAIVGSSFVSLVRAKEPIGLLQHNGAVISAVEQHGYTRILGITPVAAGTSERPMELPSPRRFKVVHRSAWRAELFSSAIQAGPGIVERGQLDISRKDLTRPRFFRSFVAACGDEAVVGASLVPVHLYTLGGALVEYFKGAGLECNDVVNLAGDREAVLLVRNAAAGAYLGNPKANKAALIGFRPLPAQQTTASTSTE